MLPSSAAPIIVAVNCLDSFIRVFAFTPKMQQFLTGFQHVSAVVVCKKQNSQFHGTDMQQSEGTEWTNCIVPCTQYYIAYTQKCVCQNMRSCVV